MVEPDSPNNVFAHISSTFSTTDIRTVYNFIKMIGGGHFGTVRLATLKSDPQITYAIKSILRANIAKDIRLLEEELAILQAVDHPNIVKYHGMQRHSENEIDIVLEMVSGGSIRQILDRFGSFEETLVRIYTI